MTNSGFGTLYILAEHTIKRRTPFCCELLNSFFMPSFVRHLLDSLYKSYQTGLRRLNSS